MTPDQVRFLDQARTAVLATIDPAGRPRLVPICFVVQGGSDAGMTVWTPLDEKPKRVTDPHGLARVRDILDRPEVSILVDRWDEDWTRLAWLRIHGWAEIVDPGSAVRADPAGAQRTDAIRALRAKYPQYADHDLESRPLIRIEPTEASSWGDM